MPKQGSLNLVGTGFNVAGQVTAETLSSIKNADEVLTMLGDPASGYWLQGLRPDAVSMLDRYGVGKPRRDTYEEITNHILDRARSGSRVCVAFYGHPGVFVAPSHAALRQARKEGLQARMHPGISAESCLFADLGVDPVARGCQSFEATDLLVRQRRFDTSSSLVLWQIGGVGVSTYFKKAFWSQSGLDYLTDRLLEVYPENHEVVVYEASPMPVCDARIDRLPLRDLPKATVSIISTLFVPPLAPVKPDNSMLGRLKAVLGKSACRTPPGSEPIQLLPPEPACSTRDGRLTVVGLGYGLAGQVTKDARHYLDNADKLVYLVSDPLSSAWLKKQYPGAESLHTYYGDGDDSEVFKPLMTEAILAPVREGMNVCAAFTGHPAIVVPPAISAVSRARVEGYRARILPSVSIEDCLIAELGVDPGVNGRMLYDATDFLLRPRVLDTSSSLILLQVGTLGERLYRSSQCANPDAVSLLSEALQRDYSPDDKAVVYETPNHPLGEARVIETTIAQLPEAELSVISTIYIPPARSAEKNTSVMGALGLA